MSAFWPNLTNQRKKCHTRANTFFSILDYLRNLKNKFKLEISLQLKFFYKIVFAKIKNRADIFQLRAENCTPKLLGPKSCWRIFGYRSKLGFLKAVGVCFESKMTKKYLQTFSFVTRMKTFICLCFKVIVFKKFALYELSCCFLNRLFYQF